MWERLDRSSEEYKRLKRERSEILYEAVRRAIPDVRDRVEIEMIGTPLTHKRFLRRDEGTYGGHGWVGGDSTAISPSAETGVDGLYCVGDSMFPGPGVPAVAAGGAILANSLTPVLEHYSLLEKVLQRSRTGPRLPCRAPKTSRVRGKGSTTSYNSSGSALPAPGRGCADPLLL